MSYSYFYPFNALYLLFVDMSDAMAKTVLSTDSRRRLDRYYLQMGDVEKATQWKRVAEFQQREEEKARKQKAEAAEKEMTKEQRVYSSLDIF